MVRQVQTIAIVLLGMVCHISAVSQCEAASDEDVSKAKAALIERFATKMSGVKLVGQFTIVGRETPPSKEEYEISEVKKMPDGDYWLFKTRIKYGDKDVSVPLPIEVKWAGDTPIITLTDFTIPGMGTFSSRVVIYKGRYAGTWTHGKVGGHLFGTIEKLTPPAQDEISNVDDKKKD